MIFTKLGKIGKIGKWLQVLFSDRKYRTVVNGEKFALQDMLSGFLKPVLAALLFIIKISDIDENLEHSIIRLFADDTKFSAKIKLKEVITLLKKILILYINGQMKTKGNFMYVTLGK